MTAHPKKLSLNILLVSFVLIGVELIMYGCKTIPEISRRQLKVIYTKLPVFLFDESGKTSDIGKRFLSEIISTEKKCEHTYVLDPEIIRPDLGLKHSIATIIERSGVVATTKPQVVVKYLKQKLDTLLVPENFIKKPTNKSTADSSFFNYLQSEELQGDSVIVFMTNNKNPIYEYGHREYKTFSDVDETRKQIQSVLCSNPKATIALLIDPPSTLMSSQVTIADIRQDCNVGTLTVQVVGGDGSPITYGIDGLSSGQSSNKFTLPTDKRNGKSLAIFAMQKGQRASKQFTTNCTAAPSKETVERTSIISRRTVVSRTWTRVAGSNFCVGSCVLAYTERDNLGHTRERRIENYAGCCPANN